MPHRNANRGAGDAAARQGIAFGQNDAAETRGQAEGAQAPLNYEGIKALAAALGRPASTLYALAEGNDPFYVTPARQEAADWFVSEVWRLLDPADGTHLRRLHYMLVSQSEPPTKLDGTAYENTESDWREFSRASLAARELGLVDAGLFVDRRAGDPPVVYVPDDEASDAGIFVGGGHRDRPPPEESPVVSYTRRDYGFPDLPRILVSPPKVTEGYSIEIWVEKSTMNDVLVPLAHRLNLTLVTGLGELSLTHCHQLVERVREHGRKTRILYISDFDPAGNRMPLSVARKVEHILRRDGADLDIRLDPLLLTREQVAHYRLPRVPIKDSDRGKRHFESSFGEGAVELDALEALYPGELARLVEEATAIYREPTKQARKDITTVAGEAWDQAITVHDEVYGRHARDIAGLRGAHARMLTAIAPHQDALDAITADYARRCTEHAEAINVEVARFYDLIEPVWMDITGDLAAEGPDADDFNWPEPDDADESENQLFDSTRGYVEQIDRYKHYQGRPTARRRKGNGGKP